MKQNELMKSPSNIACSLEIVFFFLDIGILLRIRKGKAQVKPENEEITEERPFGLLGASLPRETSHRPLIRPIIPESPSNETKVSPPTTLIPPPPAKHVEREKFFQEKRGDGSLSGHMRGLSIHSRNASTSSYNGSISSNE